MGVINIREYPGNIFATPLSARKKIYDPPIQELIFLWPPPLKKKEQASMTNFSMYFQQFWHGTPGWATCPFKMFFFFFFCFVLFCFVFCTEVPMDDIKSAVHRLKAFAQDAAQVGQALARGKHHLTLEIFSYTILGGWKGCYSLG